MDYSTARERRRTAAASRRAARNNSSDMATTNKNNDNGGDGGGFCNIDEEHQQHQHHHPIGHHHNGRIKKLSLSSSSPHRQPLEKSFLSSLSQALTNIDRHNNDYFFSSSSASSNHNLFLSPSSSSSNNNSNNNIDNNRDGNDKILRMNTTNTNKPTSSPPTNFSSYLNFTPKSLYVLLLFTSCYLLVLFCTLPMISYSNIQTPLPTTTTDDNNNNNNGDHIQQGASFTHIRGHHQYQQMKQQLGTLKQRAVQWEQQHHDFVRNVAREKAVQLQERERDWIDRTIMDKLLVNDNRDGTMIRKMSQLLDEAVEEFEEEEEMEERRRKNGKENDNNNNSHGQDEHWLHALESWDQIVATNVETEDGNEDEGAALNHHLANGNNNNNNERRPGFIVLGMHRSGTSMLSGLLVEGFGYETGGPLIMPNFDNEKGFYERIDVVLQNDEFFRSQQMGWSFNVINYDSEKALRDKLQSRINFDEGKRALQFLNNHHKTLPYLQKDPRMCIALPTWLKLLDDEPAIVFTYRHPLEVAMSLKKREESFTLEHGLRLWIVYNMRAIQNSVGLCRVFSTNEAVIKDPTKEVQRIKNELTDTCHVLPPPTSLIPQKVVNSFIDPNLQHNSNERKKEEKTSNILKDFGDGCIAKEFESDYEKGSSNYEAETQIFLMAMQIFCDFENGKAYDEDYEWPDLVHWQRPARIN